MQQLQHFTRRMMEGVIADHTNRTEHDRHCCALADEYSSRLAVAAPEPATAPAAKVPAPRAVPGPPRPITPPMARYIRGLRRKIAMDLLSPKHRGWVETVYNGDEILMEDGRELLDAMISLADRTSEARRFPEPSYIPEEGPYQVGDDVYLVVTGKETGRRYAKKFDPETCKFYYAGQQPFDLLTADCRMTADEAKVFADLYRVCCNCGRRLTKAHSKDLGYGPTCAENQGWPY